MWGNLPKRSIRFAALALACALGPLGCLGAPIPTQPPTIDSRRPTLGQDAASADAAVTDEDAAEPEDASPDAGTGGDDDPNPDAGAGDADVDAATGESCGGAGEVCCPGNGCRNGGCCALERDDRRFYCVAAGDACDGGATCQAGACGDCGGIGQMCCAGRCTAPGAGCQPTWQGGGCVVCGAAGQACCPGQPGTPAICTEPGMGCGAGDICAPCGAEGLACCDGVNDCPGGTACGAERTCERCGGLGQICCAGGCGQGAACDPGSGRCQRCGGLGEICCAGQTCTSSSSVCYPLEPEDPVEQPALCRACGSPGQPCCAAGSCQSPATCSGSETGICL
jgi:hypothetical protein